MGHIVYLRNHLSGPSTCRRNLLMPGENKYSFYRNARPMVSLVSFLYIANVLLTINMINRIYSTVLLIFAIQDMNNLFSSKVSLLPI